MKIKLWTWFLIFFIIFEQTFMKISEFITILHISDIDQFSVRHKISLSQKNIIFVPIQEYPIKNWSILMKIVDLNEILAEVNFSKSSNLLPNILLNYNYIIIILLFNYNYNYIIHIFSWK